MRLLFALLFSSVAFAQTPGYNTTQGLDTDTVIDAWDNCLAVNNSDQVDADDDGIGNRCDADLDESGLVTAADDTILRSRLNTADPVADLNVSGRVTAADAAVLRSWMNRAPGAAAVAYATVGGSVYAGLTCSASECANGLNEGTQHVLRTVAQGLKCYPLPANGIFAGATYVWGLDRLQNPAGYTRCYPVG